MSSPLAPSPSPLGAVSGTRAAIPWAEVLGAFAVARVLVAAGYAIAEGVESVLGVDLLHLSEGLITWDGTFYWSIASDGYDGGEGLRFFPLYPLLGRALSVPLGGSVGLALVLIANLAALGCLVLLARLVTETTGDEDLARRSVWLMALFPAANAFVLAYSESLMLAATLGALLAIRRDRWWIAAALGYAAGLTRPAAVLLAVPFAIEAWRARRGPVGVLPRVATVLAAPAGVLTYLFWVGGEYGDWLEPVDIQRRLRAGFQDPFTRLWDGVSGLASASQLDAVNVVFAVGFVVLVVVCIRTQPLAWWAYALATLVVALSAENIDSIGRYGLVAFPFVVALARLGTDERVWWGMLALSAGGLVTVSAMSTLGTYTP